MCPCEVVSGARQSKEQPSIKNAGLSSLWDGINIALPLLAFLPVRTGIVDTAGKKTEVVNERNMFWHHWRLDLQKHFRTNSIDSLAFEHLWTCVCVKCRHVIKKMEINIGIRRIESGFLLSYFVASDRNFTARVDLTSCWLGFYPVQPYSIQLIITSE